MDISRLLLVTIFVVLFFCILVLNLAFIMVVPTEYGSYGFIILPTSIILSLAVYIMKQNPIDIKKIQDVFLKNNKNSQVVISIVFSKYIRNKYNRIVIGIFIGMLLISYLCITLDLFDVLIIADLIMLFYSFCLLFRGYIISIRVNRGLFGTNATETKELLKFILSHSNNIDFNDKEGGLKEIFLKEKSDSTILSINKNLGELYS